MIERISVSIIIRLMVVFGATGHEFGEQHCSPREFWGTTDWGQLQIDDEKAYVAKHCAMAHGEESSPQESTADSALHYVIRAKNTHLMQLLVENGDKVDAKNNFGDTPIHDAATWNHLEAIEMLIANGADVNAKDKDHNVPLHYAGEYNNLIASGKLISNGADVNSISRSYSYFQDKSCYQTYGYPSMEVTGYSPLHIAAMCGYRGIAQLLVESGSDIDKCSKEDGTPLHLAAKNGHADIVEILIDNGAQVSAVTGKYGVTPLYLAVARTTDHYAVCELLVNAGANIYAPASRLGRYYSPPLPIEHAEGSCLRAMKQSGQFKKRSKLIKPSLDCF